MISRSIWIILSLASMFLMQPLKAAEHFITSKTELELDFGKAGRHNLRFRFVDPGIVMQKILIDFGGLKPSYLGAPSSELIK